MTDPVSAIRSLPRFAYLSPAEAREVVLAVLGAVRDNPSPELLRSMNAAWFAPSATGFADAYRAAIDALVAEVQEEGPPLPPASDSVDS